MNHPSHLASPVGPPLAGRKDLEDDLHTHIHLENSVLFPKALALTQTNQR